jgi:hypothetical protein
LPGAAFVWRRTVAHVNTAVTHDETADNALLELLLQGGRHARDGVCMHDMGQSLRQFGSYSGVVLVSTTSENVDADYRHGFLQFCGENPREGTFLSKFIHHWNADA